MVVTRRLFLGVVPAAGLIQVAAPARQTGGAGVAALPGPAVAARSASAGNAPASPPASFPSQDPALAREIVGASHGRIDRVRELLQAHPALAKASWDWGYGDWETALGAASHVGNREIAELLLASGAPPTIFSAAMLGQLGVVKALLTSTPGLQRMRGAHGLTLSWHARAGGTRAADVLAYLESVGDADHPYTNAPLSEADQRGIAGRYAFGDGPSDVFIVAAGSRGLTIQREGATAARLFHLGDRTFHPPGAEAVRVKFEGPADRPTSLTVTDGPLVVVARRVDE